MKFAIGGFATMVFALLPIATTPLAAASPDEDFVGALARSGLSFPAQATSGVINAGHAVCQGFANGATSQAPSSSRRQARCARSTRPNSRDVTSAPGG